MLSKEIILNALATIVEQDGVTDIVKSGRISGITLLGGKVGFVLALKADEAHHSAALEAACEREVRRLDGVAEVTIVTTSDAAPTRAAPVRRSEWNMSPLPFVRSIIAVASGKGGVGKSTTTVNLAHALTALGLRVGVVDADIYGPSLPRMLRLKGKPENNGNLLVPMVSHDIACLSMGVMVEESTALIWRGPQASRALYQLLRGTQWGTQEKPLDVLLIDMPPGTGDVHLSLVQQVPVNGAIIVTTPQDVAVADARKALDMFRKVYVRVLGVVENMSGFADAAGRVHAIFGEGGGRKLAEECHVPLLGNVPIEVGLREASDKGEKFNDTSGVFASMARQLQSQL